MLPALVSLPGGTTSAQDTKAVQIQTDDVTCLAYSRDSQLLAGGGMDEKVRLWDMRNNQLRSTLAGPKGWVLCVAFAPDGLTIAGGSADGNIYLWDVKKSKLSKTLEGHNGRVLSLAYSPDGATLVSSSTRPPMVGEGGKTRGQLKLWDAATGKLKQTLLDQDGDVGSLAFSSDGKLLAVSLEPPQKGNGFCGVKLFDPVTGREKQSLPYDQGFPAGVAFSPDSKYLASGGGHCKPVERGCIPTGEIKLWDLDAGKAIRTFTGQDNGYFSSVAFSPNGRTLLSGAAGKGRGTGAISETKLWEVQTGKLLWSEEGDWGFVWAVAYSPDGASIASCDGGSLKLSDPERGTLREVLFRTSQKAIRR
jgi:WD40 repeat protein